ncbi:Hpt domain-containing protein [Vibrio sp. YMD68]|uniref:quorum-sensing phosphorelay protein LuxU n=1 Tax=Vibrio sp. YMD68 TaxID=3042300 RepID=UPI00249C6B5C|nr:quorum-sensing phosphorelay protein LuxU [Vibrio sp. YMD68]WGW01174.1 Hpt domain-containing protein [Vibrio sp. YMD68]
MDVLNKIKVERLSNEIGPENVPVLLDIFLDELGLYAETLLSKEGHDKVAYLKEISHALKSSAASFGADRLCQLSIDIDMKIKTGQGLDPQTDSTEMVSVLELTRDVYQALVTK